MLINLKFTFNNAQSYGGALNIYYSGDILVFNCSFKDNAADFGGAIAYDDEDYSPLTLTLRKNIFENNKAKIGGAIKINRKIPIHLIDHNLYDKNMAYIYGTNYASEHYRIVFSDSFDDFENKDFFDIQNFKKKKNFRSINVIPGETLPINFYFIVLDVFNQKVVQNYSKFFFFLLFYFKNN